MPEKERILQVIYQAVEEVNELFPKDQRLEKKPETRLYAEGGGLDSVNLVRFIIETEQKLEEELDITISIASERAFSMKNSPFLSINALAEFITKLIQEEAHA